MHKAQKAALVALVALSIGLGAVQLFPGASGPEFLPGQSPQALEQSDGTHFGYGNPDQFFQYHHDIRSSVDGTYEYPLGYRTQELGRVEAVAKSADSHGLATERGPGNVGGRTRPVVVDPDDPQNTWWAGSASGGLWKTTNGGGTWVPVADEFPVLSINCIAMAASNPDVMYVGTGEGFGNGDTVPGDGMFKSVDRGNSWEHLASTAGNWSFRHVHRCLVDPVNTEVVLAATNAGIFRSTDGGVSWSNVYNAGVAVHDLRAQPGNFSRQLAGAMGIGIIVSNDAGLTWEIASMITAGSAGRHEIAFAPSDTSVAFAAADGGAKSHLYRSTDGGRSWVPIIQTGTITNWLYPQGLYDNTLAVHPYSPDTVFLGGINLWKAELDELNVNLGGPSRFDQGGTESWMTFINFSANRFGGRVWYIHSDAVDVTSTDYNTIEIRFGQGTQNAHRYTVSETAGSAGNGGPGVPFTAYTYEDYIEVPFQVWDTENNQQLMVSFRDQADDGAFNLIEFFTSLATGTRDLQSREYLFIHKYAYNATTPHASLDENGGVVNGMLYFMWPVLANGATWNAGALPNQTIEIEYSRLRAVLSDVSNQLDPNRQAHVDHHSIVTIPIDETARTYWIVNANDGGVAVSKNAGKSFDELDDAGSGYNTSQFYGIAKRPGIEQYIGGMQDNGTWISWGPTGQSSTWYHKLGGDGFDAIWHAKDASKVMATIQYSYILRSVDEGVNFYISMSWDFTNGQFFTSLATSDTAPDTVYTIRKDGVWRTANFGQSWTLTPITEYWGGWSGGKIRVSLADHNVVWAGYGMSYGRRMHVSRDAGTTFTATEMPANGLVALISGLATSPDHPERAYALFSRYSQPKVLETRDYGRNWRDLSGFADTYGNVSTNGFPNVAVHDLLVMPGEAHRMWVGTDIGLFETKDAGRSWNSAPHGMPPVSIYRMKLRDGQIVVATHGRGMWTIPQPPPDPCELKPPAVTHDPLAAIQDPSEAITIELEAVPYCSDSIVGARVYYQYDLAPEDTINLVEGTFSQFSAELPPVPENTTSLSYYLEVQSELGLTTYMPDTAPEASYDVSVHCEPKPPLAFHGVPATVLPGDPLTLALDALPACGVPVSSVALSYSVDGGPFSTLALAQTGTATWSTDVDVPQAALMLSYHFEVTAEDGQTALLPAGAPGETFTVAVAQDQSGPTIAHRPLTHVPRSQWPPRITAAVTDSATIARVWVSYERERLDGSLEPGMEFDLTRSDSVYTGTFPTQSVLIGERIHYRLWARDSSHWQNVSQLPPDTAGAYRIDIIKRGILASYGFEKDAAFDSTGQWRRTTPGYGLSVAHTGANAWVTAVDAPYSSEVSISTLEMPAINLSRFNNAWLEFWHWHDFEHDGITEPLRSPDGSALDGGTVKLSLDHGTTWQVLPMESGYTAVMPSVEGMPLKGDSAFAGYSYGWRRALAQLPQAADVRIRFVMGTGSGNVATTAHGYAGWALDDVRVLEKRPQDKDAPSFVTVPAQAVSILPGIKPFVSVELADSTGIADALLDYRLILRSGMQSYGQSRLAMDTANLTIFADSLPFVLAQGDYVEYRITARDFDANELVAPADMTEAFTISANLHEASVLAQATLTGLWEESPGGGYAATGAGTDAVSSILLQPFALPFRAMNAALDITHTFQFDSGSGGNMKISGDGGATWNILAPVGGYSGSFSDAGHAMDGEPVFAGSGSAASTFDLAHLAGRSVHLRIDLGTSGGLGSSESWEITDGKLIYATGTGQTGPPGEVELYSNYPDPFRNRTTVSYTLSEAMPVHIEVYNVLGQRVRMLPQGEQSAATHTIQVDLSGLAGGVYLLRLRAGNRHLVEPLILMQ